MPSGSRVTRAAVVLHGRPEALGSGLARLESVAKQEGVELVVAGDASRRRRRPDVDVAIVLGGDGTMLRALHAVPRDGRPGDRRQLRPRRVPQRDPARRARARRRARLRRRARGRRAARRSTSTPAASGSWRSTTPSSRAPTLGRMVELEWSIGGEDFGRVPCDGLICSTPSGSTAYNLSNGGPVLMWGLDAMALTFVAPHDLRARPFVVPRGRDLHVWNRTAERRLRRARRRSPRRRRGARGARVDPARRAALAARHPARGDVRPPLPSELRELVATRRMVRPSGTSRRRTAVRRRASGLPSARCCVASGSRTSSSFARPSSSWGRGSTSLTRRDRRRQDDLRPGDRAPPRRQG